MAVIDHTGGARREEKGNWESSTLGGPSHAAEFHGPECSYAQIDPAEAYMGRNFRDFMLLSRIIASRPFSAWQSLSIHNKFFATLTRDSKLKFNEIINAGVMSLIKAKIASEPAANAL
jgi:hypothetical protein